jgi:hypothetical protein
MRCSGAAATEELVIVHGKATIHGAGATEKPQVILKTVKQMANIGVQEDLMPLCAEQALAVFAAMLDMTEVACAHREVRADTSSVLTVV